MRTKAPASASRPKPRSSAATECGPVAVHVIDPNAVFLVDDARRLLRLRASTIRREVREGHLRIAKRAGRYYILGRWLLQWIREGEIRRRKQDAGPAQPPQPME